MEKNGGNEVAQENAVLKAKYEDLQKEVAEKVELMEKQIQEKESASGNIEGEMQEKIKT